MIYKQNLTSVYKLPQPKFELDSPIPIFVPLTVRPDTIIHKSLNVLIYYLVESTTDCFTKQM